MGNGQSAPPAQRAPNKLSKPRTNSWTPLSSPKFGSRSRCSSQPNILRYSQGTAETVISEDVEQEEIAEGQAHLLRPRSSQGDISPMDIHTETDGDYFDAADILTVNNPQTVEMEDDTPNSPTRGSAKRSFPRPARLSFQNLPYPSHKRSVSFVSGTSPIQPSSAKLLRFTGVGEEDKPKRRSGLLQRAQSDTNLYAPTRRRSFMQPGIATRTSGGDTDPLRWFRRGSSSRNAQNQRGGLANPPQSALLSIPPMAPKLEVDPPCTRAETPSGSDYGHIGAFKLGSLRITNGAASPAPSDIPTTVCGDEEYVSASEGRPSLQSDEEDTEPGSLDEQEVAPYPRSASSDSTPRQGSPDLNISTPEPQAIDTAPSKSDPAEMHIPAQEFALFKFTDSPGRPETPRNTNDQIDALSPLSLQKTPPLSPNLQVQATSKPLAEDDLFEPEPQPAGEAPSRTHGSFDSGYHGLETPVAVKINALQDFELKLLAKSDSGYSSNMSLRSCTSNPTVVSVTEGFPAPSRAQFSSLDKNSCSSGSVRLHKVPTGRPRQRATSAEETVSSASSVSYLTARPKRLISSSRRESDAARSSTRPSPPVSYKYPCPDMCRESASQRPSRTPSVQNPRAEPAHSSSFTSTGIFPNTRPTSRWRSSSTSTTRHSSQPLFTAQAELSPAEQLSIPPVPKETSHRFERRSESYPIVRFPNFGEESSSVSASASSDDALERVFSNGSMEFVDEPPRVPGNTPIQDGPVDTPILNHRHSLGVFASAEIPTSSVHQALRSSFGDEARSSKRKSYHGLGLQATTHSNVQSNPEINFERGRRVSRDAPSLHSIERSVPRRYYSECGHRCPSCGPSPQTEDWRDQRSYSMVSQYHNPHASAARARRARQKSLPPLPVSMRTQERMHASHMALHAVQPSVITLPFPHPEDRNFDRGLRERQASGDSWKNQKSFWARRTSIDSQQHSRSTRPSTEYGRPQTLNYHLNFDMRPRGTSYESEHFEPTPIVGWEQRGERYDGSFRDQQWAQQDPYDEPHGTYYYSKANKSPMLTERELESGHNNDDPFFQHLPEAVQWRGTPATNPLVPDGFAGDVPDRYDAQAWDMRRPRPKRPRRSLKDSHAWGVAINAVPALLQKVKITKS